MSETRVPAIPTPTDANLREVARAVKALLDVREGLLGDPLDAVVKFRDLVDAGVVSVSLTRRGGGSAGLVVIPAAPDTGYDPTTDLNPPPAPQNFTVAGLFAAVQLSWQLPAIENYAYTEIWRADTNALGSAVRIATTPASLYADFIGNSATKYYWVRFVTQANVVGPYNATQGTAGTASPDPAFLLGLLTGEITESQLYQSLQNRIGLIDGSGAGSVNARIANEAFLRGQAIAAEALLRLSGDQSLQDQINLLASGTSGDLSALIAAVNAETAARIAADLSEADARALADSTINAALNAEETARAVGDSALSAADAALGAGLSGVSASLQQESDTRVGADSAAATQALALAANVGATAGALVVEQEVRAQADSAAVTQVTTLAARVDLGDAQNTAGLVVEQQARADADGALSAQTVSLAAQAGDNLAALRVEQNARATETQALASQATTVAATSADNAAGLAQEIQARTDADSAAATQTASLAASTSGLQAAITTEQSVRAADDAAAASQVLSLASRVDVGDSTNAAAIQQEQLTRADADSAQAAETEVLSSAVGENASAIVIERDARADQTQALSTQSQTIGAAAGAALAGLVAEQDARAGADAASASQTQQLAARVGDAVAGLQAEQSVSVERDSALASQSTQLVAAVGQAAAGITAEAAARADADAANAQQITGVAARFGDSAAGVQQEQLARASADEVIGRQVLALAAGVGTNEAGLRAEQTVRVNADSALSSSITTLSSQVNDPTTGLPATRAVLFNDYYTRAGTDSAISSATSSLVSTTALNNALGNYTTTASLQANYYTKTQADSAISSATSSLVSTTALNSVLLGYAPTSALQVEQTTRANADVALSNSITTLQASIDGNTVSIQNESIARVHADGTLFAKYTVKIDNNGYVSGFGLASEANNATPFSSFAVRADSFYIANPSGVGVAPAMPFIVRTTPTTLNGVSVPVGVYLTDAFIQNGTITNAKIGNLAVDNAKIADLAVNNAKIADLSADKLTSGTIAVGQFVQSTGYSSGQAGFRIDGDGNAEFNNATVRGTVFASDGQFVGEVIALGPGKKARMWAGDFEVYKDVPSVGLVLYKALSRVESGVGTNNVQVTIPGYFLNQPRVIVSPANIRLYDSAYANQTQSLQCEARDLTQTAAGSMVWRFTPVATLSLGASAGQVAVNQSSGQVSTGWTSGQYVTPANTATITPSVTLASYRGTGTSGGYYRRTARWRVQYLNGGTWVDGAWTTIDLASAVNASATSDATFTFPSAAAWTFRIQFEAYDTGGTFSTTVEYENATDNVTRSDAQTIQAQVAFGGPNSASASLNYVPSYSVPSGWTLTGVNFSYVYSYSVSSNGFNARAEVAQTPYSGGLSLVAPPNSSGSNLSRSRSASSNTLDFSVSATRAFSSESATATLTLHSVSGTYSRRRPLTNSTAAANTFTLGSYGYQLNSAQVLASGTLNWVAIGE